MIPRDAPAQVDDRGRRRDGGLSFTIVLTGAVVKRRNGDPNLAAANRRRMQASGLSPTPSVCRQFRRDGFSGAAVT